MSFRIVDRKPRKGARTEPGFRQQILANESERLFGAKDERHLRYMSTFAAKAEQVRSDLADADALESLASKAGHLIKKAPTESPHSQLPVDIGTLLDLL